MTTLRITANFERNLEEIRTFLAERDARQAYETLLGDEALYLLAIRHHRQISFDFPVFWGASA